jgi:hypothetical protein
MRALQAAWTAWMSGWIGSSAGTRWFSNSSAAHGCSCTGTFLLGPKTIVGFQIYDSEIEYAEDIQSQLGHILQGVVIDNKSVL